MSPLRVIIDTNIVGALFNDPGTVAIVARLQRSGAIRLLITHREGDQMARESHHIRRTLQLLNPAIAVTSGKTWNVSEDHSSYGDTVPEERSMEQGNQRSFEHWAKFMIALTAVSRVDVVVTNDRDLRNAAKQEVQKGSFKLQVWNYEEFVKQLKILGMSRS
jgi:predicted nucleic acid-binding protein